MTNGSNTALTMGGEVRQMKNASFAEGVLHKIGDKFQDGTIVAIHPIVGEPGKFALEVDYGKGVVRWEREEPEVVGEANAEELTPAPPVEPELIKKKSRVISISKTTTDGTVVEFDSMWVKKIKEGLAFCVGLDADGNDIGEGVFAIEDLKLLPEESE